MAPKLSSPYADMPESKPFRLLVGPDKTEFYIHPPFLARHSKPLNALVNGQMKESKEGCATLEDVDVDTFIRFTEFLYTGDYPAAPHAIILDSTNTQPTFSFENFHVNVGEKAAEKPAQASSGGPAGGTEHTDLSGGQAEVLKPSITTSQQAWTNFLSRHRHPKMMRSSGIRPNREPCEEYADVFLSHAKLYVLADVYDVAKLRDLSLRKLHRTLCAFTLHAERTGDITKVLEFVYENTADRADKADELRAMVLEYVACKVKELMNDEKFKELMMDNNPIALDLLRQLRSRLD